MLHINGILQFVVFCVCLLSLNIMFLRFIHIVVDKYTSTSFLFWWLNDLLYGYTTICYLSVPPLPKSVYVYLK